MFSLPLLTSFDLVRRKSLFIILGLLKISLVVKQDKMTERYEKWKRNLRRKLLPTFGLICFKNGHLRGSGVNWQVFKSF